MSALRWWRWRLGTRARQSGSGVDILPDKPASTPVAQFIPVEIVRERTKTVRARSASTMEIVLRRDRRVRVEENFDAHLLARIVKVLETIP